MKATRHFLSGAVLAAVVFAVAGDAAAYSAGEALRVTADRVNMRAKPGFENSEVLGQLPYDGRVVAVREEGEWVGVVPPESVAFWVHGDYVGAPERVVTANRINVRAGPSVNYSVLSTLERGAKVDVRKELDGWLEIAPPEGTCVWVYRDYVAALDAPPAAAPAPAPVADTPPPPPPPVATPKPRPADPPPPPRVEAAPLPEPIPLPAAPTTNSAALAKPSRRQRGVPATRTDAPLAPTPVPVPEVVTLPPAAKPDVPTPIVAPSAPAASSDSPLPATFKLVPLDGQGKTAVYEGVLRAAPLFNDGPTRYRVLVWQQNRWQIQCHVYGEAAKFRALQDKTVRVRGREYWVQDTSAPVLVPDQIQELVPQQEN